MIIVISPEQNVAKETCWVNKLLEAGLDCFHIRKPQMDDIAIANYIGEIEKVYYSKIVLHDRSEIAVAYGLECLHYSERERDKAAVKMKNEFVYSTSVHDIQSFNALDEKWNYAFLSPVFPSVSKPNYGHKSNVMSQMKKRTNFKTKLIGLGGITAQNMQTVLAAGADGVALLGTIWQSDNPLNRYKQCEK